MSYEALLTLLVTVAAVGLFISERLPMDVVAMLVLASLLLLGLVSPAEALSGFSNEATITVAAMFVLSAGLAHTGALGGLGRLLARVRWRWLFVLLLILVAGAVSAFINNTAVVAVFLPMVLAACAHNGQSPSQVLIPLSYASQMGGVCTLVGTSTNLLVNSVAKDLGHPGFGMFDFTPLGVVVMAFGLSYLAIFGRWLLPHHPAAPITESWQLGKYVTELRVMEGSPLVGRSVANARLADKYAIHVLELIRDGEPMLATAAEALREGDLLLVRGEWDKLSALRDKLKLEPRPEFKLSDSSFGAAADGQSKRLLEVMVAPDSRLAGQTLDELDFTRQHEATVLAVHRRGQVVRERLRDVSLTIGDVLLMLAPQAEVDILRRDERLVVLNEREDSRRPPQRALLALLIVAAVIASAALGWLPIVAAAILGGIALVVSRCVGNEQAYKAVDWRVIVLLAGVLPLGIAMQKSGLAQSAAALAVAVGGGFGPLALLAVIYLLTALLTEFMSNNAAAVLVTPIAFSTAVSLGVDPTPFIVAVLFAASTSFSTPVGYQTNMMVYNAGNYRFTDFLRMGLPLNLMFWVLAVILIPRFFPF
jgi:di/tricarboxylate transporter